MGGWIFSSPSTPPIHPSTHPNGLPSPKGISGGEELMALPLSLPNAQSLQMLSSSTIKLPSSTSMMGNPDDSVMMTSNTVPCSPSPGSGSGPPPSSNSNDNSSSNSGSSTNRTNSTNTLTDQLSNSPKSSSEETNGGGSATATSSPASTPAANARHGSIDVRGSSEQAEGDNSNGGSGNGNEQSSLFASFKSLLSGGGGSNSVQQHESNGGGVFGGGGATATTTPTTIMGAMMDQTALFQQLFAAQSKQHQQSVASPASAKPHQRQPKSPLISSRSDEPPSSINNGNGQERKRTYPYTFQFCVLCQKNVHSSKLPCHIRQCHVGKPMFQCPSPSCDFTSTYSKNNVKSHMVSLHGLAGDPISYMDQYAGQVEEFMKRCFPNVRGRGRPVHGRVSPTPLASSAVAGARQQRMSSYAGTGVRKSSGSGGSAMKDSLPSSNNKMKGVQQPTRQQHQQQKEVSNFKCFNDLYAMMAMLGSAHNNTPSFYSPPPPPPPPQQQPPPVSSATAALGPLNPLLYLQQLSELSRKNQQQRQQQQQQQEQQVVAAAMMLPQMVDQKPFSFPFNGIDFNGNGLAPAPMKEEEEMEEVEVEKSTSVHAFPALHPHPHHDSSTISSSSSSCVEARYLPQDLKWSILEKRKLDGTVFKTFTNPSELVEKMDLAPFEALLDASSNGSGGLLTEKQAKRIAEVRTQLGLKTFEVLFAIHRLDLQVLGVGEVKLVASIAPATVDIRRFTLYEQSNSLSSLTDDEKFILQLAKIDRLKEKLAVMLFMGGLADKLASANQQVGDLLTAAKVLHDSSEFHTLLHLLLTCGNLINGDFNARLVEGFKTSGVVGMCSFQFPNGFTLLDVLADRIASAFPELRNFEAQSKLVEVASKVDFAALFRQLQHFESGLRLVETEMLSGGSNPLLSNFLASSEMEIAQLRETLYLAKDKLGQTLEFFGESIEQEEAIAVGEEDDELKPEQFFSVVAEFSAKLFESLHKMEE